MADPSQSASPLSSNPGTKVTSAVPATANVQQQDQASRTARTASAHSTPSSSRTTSPNFRNAAVGPSTARGQAVRSNVTNAGNLNSSIQSVTGSASSETGNTLVEARIDGSQTDQQAKMSRPSVKIDKPAAASSNPSVTSPALRSPPQSTSSRRSSNSSLKNSEQESMESSSTSIDATPAVDDASRKSGGSTQTSSTTAIKVPRGSATLVPSKLETVDEGDHSPNISAKLEDTMHSSRETSGSRDPNPETSDAAAVMSDTELRHSTRSNTARTLSPGPMTQASRQNSFPSLAATKSRTNAAGETSASQNMVVETETVASVPQAATGLNTQLDRSLAPARGEPPGTVRRKPSNETLRSKKTSKRPAKKPPSVISNAGSTRADIFEAKVASEIEGESSDSDETFVYESNPPEPTRTRTRRHHSRTPSGTSLQSVPARSHTPAGAGAKASVSDGGRVVRAKRSMKFANNNLHVDSSVDSETGENTDSGTVRRNGKARGPSHIGVFGRNAQNNHLSANVAVEPASESPFSQASKLRNSDTRSSSGTRTPRGPRSQETSPHRFSPLQSKFGDSFYKSSKTEDDENTPLMSHARHGRRPARPQWLQPRGGANNHNHHGRHRQPRSPSLIDYDTEPQQASCLRRCTGFIVIIFTLVLLGLAGVGFVFATTKPLADVSIRDISNVIATEQELILDLVVRAANPNIVTITIDSVDLNIFAKSRYVGSSLRDDYEITSEASVHDRGVERQRRRQVVRNTPAGASDRTSSQGISFGNPFPWPPSDSDPDRQTMLLGRVFALDSALRFDSSFFRRVAMNSSAEILLDHPGNATEEGGMRRWERVVEHPFELIVRGVLKYQVPLSTRMWSSSVGASIEVHPEEGVDRYGSMRSHLVGSGAVWREEENGWEVVDGHIDLDGYPETEM